MATQSNSSSASAQRESLIPRISITSADRNRLILVIIAGLVLYWLIAQSIDALGPFLFALALAYLMSPLVDFFNRAMPRALAILLVYVVFIAVAAGLVWWLAPRVANQIKELVDNAPVYQTRIQAWIAGLTDWYQALPLSVDVRTSLEDAVKNATGNILGVVQRTTIGILLFVSRTMGFVVGLLIIPFWLFYVLKDSGRGMAALNNMVPRSWRVDVWRIIRVINHILSSYIRGQLLLALAVGLATTAGMLIVGAPYALILGIVSGITEIIPVVGPVIGAVPGILIALVLGDWVLLLKVVLVYVVVQQLENNLLVPKIQGDSVNLHPAIIMVALVVGSQVAGLVGLILAVPTTAILRDVYLYLYRRLTEGYSPHVAEASLPTRQSASTREGKAREKRELDRAHKMPGINTESEMIEKVDKESVDSLQAPRS